MQFRLHLQVAHELLEAQGSQILIQKAAVIDRCRALGRTEIWAKGLVLLKSKEYQDTKG